MAAAIKVSILIVSCDGYSDLWRPCVNLWRRHWPGCPWPLIIGAEEADFDDPTVRIVRAPKGAVWSDCVAAFLRQVESPWVLVVLEDFFLRDRVSAGRLQRLLVLAQAGELICLRLVNRPGPRPGDRWCDSGELGVLRADAPYRVSTQAAFWRKDALARLLVPGESAWDFEMNASARARELFPDGFVGVFRDALPYGHHVVERGRWFPWDAWRFGRMDIGCDFRRRPAMAWPAATRWLARKAKDIALAPLPPGWRAALRRTVKLSAWPRSSA